MLKSSADRLPTANIGDNILLHIAKPDIMTSIGSKNMMVVVLDKHNELFSIGTKHGQLESMYTRNQFDVCPKKFLKMDCVPDNTISQTTAMQSDSLFVTSSCKCKVCNTLRCPCRKSRVHCNSRCHQGKACHNKNTSKFESWRKSLLPRPRISDH